jgi:hypothetical protein
MEAPQPARAEPNRQVTGSGCTEFEHVLAQDEASMEKSLIVLARG